MADFVLGVTVYGVFWFGGHWVADHGWLSQFTAGWITASCGVITRWAGLRIDD